jgi:hypothetical protein
MFCRGFPWLEIQCARCKTPSDVDLAAMKHPPRYVTDFIRDPKAGGCAVGVPPDNLGFRLVVERDKWLGVQDPVGQEASRFKSFL